MCLQSVGLKRAVQVDVEVEELSDWVFWCTGVDGVEEANEGGGFVGGVEDATSTSMTVTAMSFWRFKEVGMVEGMSDWLARRVTILFACFPPLEPFSGAMMKLCKPTKTEA